jgi:hypothetical protein
MIKKITFLLLSISLSWGSFAKDDLPLSSLISGTEWNVYASLADPKAEFFYSKDYIKKIGDVYEVEVLKNYQQLQYVGEGYGKEYSYMSSIEVQHIDCKTNRYQSKLVKAFKKVNAIEPAFYSEQTKGDWHSYEGNGGQKHLHKIVCKNNRDGLRSRDT